MRLIYTIFFIFSSAIASKAQVVLTPQPSLGDFFRLDEAWQLQVFVQGASTGLKANLRLQIEDNSHNLVYASTLSDLILRSGLNQIQQINPGSAQTEFGKNQAAIILRQTGSLPYGEFILCYFLNDVQSGAMLGQFCQEKRVKPMLPPELLQPYNKEKVSTTLPLLVWKGPFPTSNSPIQYALRLVEIQKGQSAEEAIERNAPLLNRNFRETTQLVYPPDAPGLQLGKSYAWRVSATVGQYAVGTTDCWTFTLEEEKHITHHDSYRILNNQQDGNHFISKNGILRFAYDNRYGAKNLNYNISSLSANKSIGYKTPEIALNPGINKIELNLKDIPALKAGEKYRLYVQQQNSNTQFLEFTYDR